ncbi:MAG: recombinase RecA [Planctomycetota bacterium]|nr:recombinase RecA [Planctomycetota bacterium]
MNKKVISKTVISKTLHSGSSTVNADAVRSSSSVPAGNNKSTADRDGNGHQPNGKGGKVSGKSGGKPEKGGGDKSLLFQDPNLRTTLQQIEKQFGEGAIMPLGTDAMAPIQGISTGSLALDIALGGRGIPRGRIVEIFGPESSGKTTLALHVVAEAQKSGGIAAFVDAEHALDPSWAKRLGVQLETLLVSQPASGEEAMHITEMLIKSNAVDVIVVDSVAALVPRQELEGDIGDSHIGLQARLMSQSMRKLTGVIAKSKTSVIFINQIREKIGVMFGSPETTPGGRALKFYCSCRVDVRRIGQLKDGEDVIGIRVRGKVVKNKVAPPFRVAEFDMLYERGISMEGDVLDLAVDQKIINKSGAWFRYGEVHIGQGKEKARIFLIENPNVMNEIKKKVLEQVALGNLKSHLAGRSGGGDSSSDD